MRAFVKRGAELTEKRERERENGGTHLEENGRGELVPLVRDGGEGDEGLVLVDAAVERVVARRLHVSRDGFAKEGSESTGEQRVLIGAALHDLLLQLGRQAVQSDPCGRHCRPVDLSAKRVMLGMEPNLSNVRLKEPTRSSGRGRAALIGQFCRFHLLGRSFTRKQLAMTARVSPLLRSRPLSSPTVDREATREVRDRIE